MMCLDGDSPSFRLIIPEKGIYLISLMQLFETNVILVLLSFIDDCQGPGPDTLYSTLAVVDLCLFGCGPWPSLGDKLSAYIPGNRA
jgi:hypothetical protein